MEARYHAVLSTVSRHRVIDHVVFEKVIDGKTFRLETKEDAGVQACLLTRNPFIANWQDIAIIDLEEYEVIERETSFGYETPEMMIRSDMDLTWIQEVEGDD